MRILLEDNHLLAVNKPAGLPTMGVAAGKPNLLDDAKQYVRVKYGKPGDVYLGVVSRLDAPVTGVVLFARTSKAARRLNELFRERRVEKTYWAIVDGVMENELDTLTHYLRKDERHRKVHVTHANAPGAQVARLRYTVLERSQIATRIEIGLETGRKHQIRVQLAKIGHPIVGDRKYGSSLTFPDGIALHARRLAFEHPVRRTPVEIVAPPPGAWAAARYGLSN